MHLLRTSTRPRLSFLLLLFITTEICHSEICNLCADGSEPTDPNAKFTYTKTNQFYTVPCSIGYELALQGEFSNCTELQISVKDICGCDGTVNDSCTLCSNGQDLPLPYRRVAGQTCQYWEQTAQKDFEMDCPAWQKSIGSYCGCDMTDPIDYQDFCRICDDKVLPYPNQQVTFIDGSSKYCALIEQDINTDPLLNCIAQQDKFGSACTCNDIIEFPSDSPTTDPSSAFGVTLLPTLAIMFVSLSFFGLCEII